MGFRTRAAAAALVISCAAAGRRRGAVHRSRRREGRTKGQGPFTKLVIRGVTLIDGTGAPPYGPVDIVIEENRIAEVRHGRLAGDELRPDREATRGRPGDRRHRHVCDARSSSTGTRTAGDPDKPRTYAYKLWLAHGVTTVRGVTSPAESHIGEKARAAQRRSPRRAIFNYQPPGAAGARRGDSPRGRASGCAGPRRTTSTGSKFFIIAATRTSRSSAALLDEAKKIGWARSPTWENRRRQHINGDSRDAGAAAPRRTTTAT